VWATEATADDLGDWGRFVSDAPVPFPIDAHSQYFYNDPRNTGLNNLGDIIAGRTPSHR
jgi:hypothetical protein